MCKVFVYLCVWTLTGVYEKYYVKRSRHKRKNGKKAKTNKQTNKQNKNKTKKKVISLRAPTHMCDLKEGM